MAITEREARPDTEVDTSERDLRQRGVLPTEALQRIHAVVVGCGAIGHQVARSLAATGVGVLSLWDFDTIEVKNLAPQGFEERHVGEKKADVVAGECRRLNSDIYVRSCPSRLRRSALMEARQHLPADGRIALFSCVDSMEGRRFLWEHAAPHADFYGDTRMQAEVIRIVCSVAPHHPDAYPNTLMAEERAPSGSCTTRSLNYTSGIAAGLVMHQFARWVRDLAVTPDLFLNLLEDQLTDLTRVRGGFAD